jgi:hypothetical protein
LLLLGHLDKAVSMCDSCNVLRKVLIILAVLPISTASCEKGFSVTNMVKKMVIVAGNNMNNFMVINVHGPSLEGFDAMRCAEH